MSLRVLDRNPPPGLAPRAFKCGRRKEKTLEGKAGAARGGREVSPALLAVGRVRAARCAVSGLRSVGLSVHRAWR